MFNGAYPSPNSEGLSLYASMRLSDRRVSITWKRNSLIADTLDQSSRNAKTRRWHLTELQFLPTTGNGEIVLNQRLIF
jgi:hypothetical protein